MNFPTNRQEDTTEIEAEIERFIAISDYLDKDEMEFIEGLKQEMTLR